MSNAEALVASLTAEGTVDSRGDFTLDMVKAREKLRRFQLLSPRLYPLELIGAAIAGGANKIEINAGLLETKYVFHNMRPYTKRELAHLYSHLFLPQTAPEQDRLRQLAIGLNACLALQPQYVEIRSESPDGTVYLRLTPDGESMTAQEGEAAPCVTISVVDVPQVDLARRVVPGYADEEIRYVRGRCKHAPVPIRIGGHAINQKPRLEPCVLQVSSDHASVHGWLGVVSSLSVGLRAYLAERERYGKLIWYTGRPLGTPLDDSQVAFMINGVIVCTRTVRLGGSIPIKALCSAPGLLKNASQSDVVENGAYHEALRQLRAVVPGLIDELRHTGETIRNILRDPKQWPHERPDLFKRYLTAELDLVDRYLAQWESERGEIAEPEVIPLSGVAPAEGPAFDENLWLAWEPIEGAWGKGWLVLPRWTESGLPSASVELVRDQRSVAPSPRFTVPVAGHVDVVPGMPETRKLTDDGAWRRALTEMTEVVEAMVASLCDGYVTFSPQRQVEARRYLLTWLGDGPLSVGSGLASATTRQRVHHLPLFETSDSQPISLAGLAGQHKTSGSVLYVVGEAAGRLLAADRKVVRVRDVELPLLRRWFPNLVEATHALQEDEKARQLLRLRGQLGTPLLASEMLVSTEFRYQGLRIVLGLPRPYADRAWLQFSKRTVFVTEQRPRDGLPVHGTVEGDDLPTNEEWTEALLPSVVWIAIHDRTDALYRSLAPALARLDAAHPDYETCCRYACQYVVERRMRFVNEMPEDDEDRVFLDLPLFPLQQGGRLSLLSLLARGRIAYSRSGTVSVSDPVVMVPEGREWLVSVLEALLGSEAVSVWSGSAAARPSEIVAERGDLVGDLLVSQLADYPGRLRLATSQVPSPEAMVGLGDRVVVASAHPVVREVLSERKRDPALLTHLALTVAATAARQADTPDAELRYLASTLKKLSAGGRRSYPMGPQR